eukprot:m.7885 g.7885  ORF g.7885 m.7885 type:complete len:75 (+) comp5939_c0_seq1:122-346(+)
MNNKPLVCFEVKTANGSGNGKRENEVIAVPLSEHESTSSAIASAKEKLNAYLTSKMEEEGEKPLDDYLDEDEDN